MAFFIRKFIPFAACCALANFPVSEASQWGPVFPSHLYPTDRSFHLKGAFEYGTQGSFFDKNASREELGGAGTLSRTRFTLSPDYQPNRALSLGAYLNFDSLKLTSTTEELTQAGFSDQYLFGEYRLVDERGYSVGFGTVFKIPLYSTPKSVAPTDESFLLLGDGQIDATLLLCTEYWPWRNVKLTGDLGLTYRTDEHASELPFQLGAEYVSPDYSIGLALVGNLSFRNDQTGDAATTADIQALTGDTRYVFAQNPETLNILFKAEYAFNHSWAVLAHLQNSVWAKNSPYFINFAAGISYRFFDVAPRARSAREVGIDTDDTSKEFEGEVQEGNEEIDRLQDDPDLEE